MIWGAAKPSPSLTSTTTDGWTSSRARTGTSKHPVLREAMGHAGSSITFATWPSPTATSKTSATWPSMWTEMAIPTLSAALTGKSHSPGGRIRVLSTGPGKSRMIQTGSPVEFVFLVDVTNSGQSQQLLPQFGDEKFPMSWYELVGKGNDARWVRHIVRREKLRAWHRIG